MVTRLKYLRKNILKLSQKEFGEKINLKQTSYSEIENLRSSLTDRNLKLICQTFNVNEDWLRNGVEPIFKENKKEKPLIDIIEEEYNLSPTSKKIIEAYLNLDKEDQAMFERFVIKLFEENNISSKKTKQTSTEDETSITLTDNIIDIEEVRETIKVKLYDMPVSAGTGM